MYKYFLKKWGGALEQPPRFLSEFTINLIKTETQYIIPSLVPSCLGSTLPLQPPSPPPTQASPPLLRSTAGYSAWAAFKNRLQRRASHRWNPAMSVTLYGDVWACPDLQVPSSIVKTNIRLRSPHPPPPHETIASVTPPAVRARRHGDQGQRRR